MDVCQGTQQEIKEATASERGTPRLRRSSLRGARISIPAGELAAGDRLLRQLLFGINLSRSLLIILACSVVVVTAALASYLPARRAASIAPTDALRTE